MSSQCGAKPCAGAEHSPEKGLACSVGLHRVCKRRKEQRSSSGYCFSKQPCISQTQHQQDDTQHGARRALLAREGHNEQQDSRRCPGLFDRGMPWSPAG